MMMMFPLLILIIFTWSGVSSQYCTGEFTCDQGQVYALCHAFTHWSHLSVIHWSQCWKFQECGDQLQCEQCVSGVSGGDCDLSSTTVSTVSGAECPPLTSDQETGMTCFPDFVSGAAISDGSHCIWVCGQDTSLHTCAGGAWDTAPPPGCYCPPLPSDQGQQYLCVPPLLDTGEGVEGAYCIMTCAGAPTMEIQCEAGAWDTDIDNISCS